MTVLLAAQVPLVTSFPWLTLLPPIVAIGLAVLLREVNFALIAAVFVGAVLLADKAMYPPDVDPAVAAEGPGEESGEEPAEEWTPPPNRIVATFSTFAERIVAQVADPYNAKVILFTVLLGAMIAVMNDSGGTSAVVGKIANYADTREKGQVSTWLAGMVIFFDDYANTMMIGGSVRSLTDRLQVSRAKLAFLIDATAAPIAGLALSTWTAVEVGYVSKGLEAASLSDANAMDIFLRTIPYRIYPIAAIIFVGAVAWSGKDFGPMLKAEMSPEKGRVPGTDVPSTTASGNVWTALIPILTLLVVVVGLFGYVGFTEGSEAMGDASYSLLLYTAMAASFAAVVSSLLMKGQTIAQCSESFSKGVTAMTPALIILVLAWSLGSICKDDGLNSGVYVGQVLKDVVSPQLLPALTFIAAGAIAVAVGSSFATMSLLLTAVIPLAWGILQAANPSLTTSDPVFLATIGAVLAGAIFGDHCSPISDTTVLSSAAAGCDHLQHVGTQVPYALLIAACTLLFGYLPLGFGVPWWITLPISTVSCVGVLLVFGKKPASGN